MASIELPVEEGGQSIEIGETATGVITGSEIDEFEHDGDEIRYYRLHVEHTETGIEFTPDWPASNVTESNGLGRVLSRFGADIQDHLRSEETIDPADYFTPGDEVAFEVEGRFNDDGEGPFFDAIDSSVRPAEDIDEIPMEAQEDVEEARQWAEEQDISSGSTGGSGGEPSTEEQEGQAGGDGEDEQAAEVLQIVEGMEGSEETDVKSTLVQIDSDFLPIYNRLVEEGEIEVEDDGSVSLA